MQSKNIGRPIDFAEDYENLAQFVARHFGKPVSANLIEAISSGYYPETMDAILSDPVAFDDRVHAYLYAEAMKHNA